MKVTALEQEQETLRSQLSTLQQELGAARASMQAAEEGLAARSQDLAQAQARSEGLQRELALSLEAKVCHPACFATVQNILLTCCNRAWALRKAPRRGGSTCVLRTELLAYAAWPGLCGGACCQALVSHKPYMVFSSSSCPALGSHATSALPVLAGLVREVV